jgi:hypothetical protein
VTGSEAKVVEEEAFVQELDMPPMAYFEIPLDIDDEGHWMPPGGTLTPVGYRAKQTIVAKTICHEPTNEHVAKMFSIASISMIKAELRALGGGIIWWRTHMEVSKKGRRWTVFGRCGTSPTLPDSFWRKLDHREMPDG